MPSLKTLKIVPIFLALLLVAGAVRAEKATERYQKTFPLTSGARFQLYAYSGNVVLEGWDRNEVRIEVEKWAESRSPQVARRTVERIHFEVDQSLDGLVFQARFPDPGVMDWLQGNIPRLGANYRIRVPRQAVLAIENSSGDITLAGTRGEAILENHNGDISVNAVQGKLSLITVNGDVKVRVPAGARMTLDASATHGAVRSDFKVAGADPKKKNVLQGQVNGGGERIFIRSVNGTIQLSKM